MPPPPPPLETGTSEEEPTACETAAISAAPCPERRGSGLSRLLPRRLFGFELGFDLEDLLILGLILILFVEDGDSDLLPLLLILLFTGK